MLYYVATYPRCGSGVLRFALRRGFGFITSNGYAAAVPMEPSDDPDLGFGEDPEFAHVPRQLMVLEPALGRLTSETRRRLANRPERLFVKTHEMPYAEWFPGEHAIQMVRHPGAAMTSFWNLKRKSNPEIQLEKFVGRPDWSGYHMAWLAAEVPILRLRYEDMFENPALLKLLGNFVGAPVLDSTVSSLAEATARNPQRNPGMGVDGWREQMSAHALDILWGINASAADALGYDLGGTRLVTLP